MSTNKLSLHHAKQAHRTIKEYLPLVQAAVTLFGFALQMTQVQETPATETLETTETPAAVSRPQLAYRSLLGMLLVLVWAAARVLVGTALVLGLVYLYASHGDITRAVTLTLLIGGVFWLSSIRASRRA